MTWLIEKLVGSSGGFVAFLPSRPYVWPIKVDTARRTRRSCGSNRSALKMFQVRLCGWYGENSYLFNTGRSIFLFYVCLIDSPANGCVCRETGLKNLLLHHLKVSRS